MKLWNVPIDDLKRIVAATSSELYDGNIVFKKEPETDGRAISFTLTVQDSSGPGGRRSFRGRRVCALCWHGHRDVMKEIFDQFPAARLVTAMADYRGQDNFESTFRDTGYRNIGSIAEPLYHVDACDCL